MDPKITAADTIPLRIVAATKSVSAWISNTAIPTYTAYQLLILQSSYKFCHFYLYLVFISTVLSLVFPSSWLFFLPRICSIKLIILSYYAGKYFRRRYEHELLIQTHSCKPIGLVKTGLWALFIYIRSAARAMAGNHEYIFRHHAHDTSGDTFAIPFVTKNVVYTRSRKIVKEVLQNDISRWDMGGYFLKSRNVMFGNTSLFVQTGRNWKLERFVFGSLLVRNDESDSACVARHTKSLVRLLITQGPRHDMKDVIGQMMVDISSEILTGKFDDSGHDSNTTTKSQQLYKYLVMFAADFSSSTAIGFMGQTLKTLINMTFLRLQISRGRVMRSIREMIDTVVRDQSNAVSATTEQMEKPSTDMGEVVGENNQVKNNAVISDILRSGGSEEHAVETVFMFIMGIVFGCGTAIEATLWLLANHPTSWRRVHVEVATSLRGKPAPSWKDIKNLRYVNMVVKESLRMYPTLTSLSRISLHDTVLPDGGGPSRSHPSLLFKGQPVHFMTTLQHNIPAVYGSDTASFRPSRWETLNPRPCEYIPFGYGARCCPAQNLSLQIITTVLVRIAQNVYDIKLTDETVRPEKMNERLISTHMFSHFTDPTILDLIVDENAQDVRDTRASIYQTDIAKGELQLHRECPKE